MGDAPRQACRLPFPGLGDNAGTFVAQEGDGLIILDQHGAHERILYEKLRENPEAAPATLERPVTAILPEDLAPEVWALEEDFGSLGFLFEPFGPDAVRVTAAPETAVDPEAAFLAALHALAGGEDLAKALACKGSTKFGESLSREGMAALLDEWSSCEFPERRAPQTVNLSGLCVRATLVEGGHGRPELASGMSFPLRSPARGTG